MNIRRLVPDKPAPIPALLEGPANEVHALRIVLADRAISLPLASIERWERTGPTEREQLTLWAGKEVFVIRGLGLELLHDALDSGIARLIRRGTGTSSVGRQLRITAILVASSPITPSAAVGGS